MTYTDDQREIVDYLREQLDNPEGHNVIVSGAGGVGKTAMLCEFISELLEEGYKVAVTAMTGKATAVIRGKVFETLRRKGMEHPGKENLCIETVTKITKTSSVVALTDDGETKYSSTWKDPRNFGYDVLFVDELSMVPHYISQWWQLAGVRVFGFGDHCQLPEVTTAETKKDLAGFRHDLKVPSITYIAGYGTKVLKDLAQKTLYKVLRSENEIAVLCGELRDFKMPKSEVIGLFKSWATKTENVQYSTSIKDLETMPDWQIICYTNKMCQQINNQLCHGEEYPELDDKIILFDNLNPLRLYNGDVLTLGLFLAKIEAYNRRAKAPIFVCMKWQGQMPNKMTKHAVERKFFQTYVQFKQQIDQINLARLNDAPSILRDSGFAPGLVDSWIAMLTAFRLKFPKPAECFLEYLQELEREDIDAARYLIAGSKPLPRLYMVNCDYGYAITTHKSQGSEYQKVCYLLERFDRPLLYTGISRAKEMVKIINLTDQK